MKKTKFFILSTTLVCFLWSCKSKSQSNLVSSKINSVETNLINPIYIEGDSTWTIASRMKHYGVPGVSIAVIEDYEIAWTKSYGVLDKKSKIPVNKQTIFLAGSVSKPIAAYGALSLVNKDKINLNEDINSYLTSWKIPNNEFTKQKKVTLKNILSHTGGITVHGFLGYNSELPIPSLLEILNGKKPSNSSPIYVDKIPDESPRYSGGGYTIMQQMMIDVEEKSFPQLMDELVLHPLKMFNSTYNQPLLDDQLEMAATGYLYDGSMVKGKRFTYPEMAAAGLWTTSEDIAKFIVNIQKTIKKDNNTVLSQSLTKKMLTPFYESGGPALGFFINNFKNDSYFFHNGWVQGFCSEFTAHKKKGYGVVVLINANQPKFISELIRSVAFTYKWDNYITNYKKVPLQQKEIKNIVGRYRLNNENIINVYTVKERLFRKNIGEKHIELIKISDTSYVSKEDGEKAIQFIQNSKNKNYNMTIRYNSGYLISSFMQTDKDEKIPLEFLEAGAWDKALNAYQDLIKSNPNDPAILEKNLNELGYHFLNLNNFKLSQNVFKINTILYPDSYNAYDSYAEACVKNGNIDLAIKNYEKSIILNPENSNAKQMIKELKKR